MEYWSVDKKAINPLAITPTLQYSNTPKLIEIESHHSIVPIFQFLTGQREPQTAPYA